MFQIKISNIEKRYYKLVILAGLHHSGKTANLELVQTEIQGPLINLNLEVSKKLREIPQIEWKNHVENIIEELKHPNNSPILIDNIEILFSSELDLNPLQILKRLSRTHVVIASWPGSYKNGQLTHGNSNDDEYFEAKGAEIEGIEIYSLPLEG